MGESPESTLTERLLALLRDPSGSYTAAKPVLTWQDWFTPILLVGLIGMAAHYVTEPIVFDPEGAVFQQELEKLPEEQRLRAREGLEAMRRQGPLMAVMGAFSSLLVVAAALWLLARGVLRTEVTFQQALVVKGYATLVLGVEWVVRTLLILWTKNPAVFTGPGALVSPEMADTYVGRVLMGINLFEVWQAVVQGVGLAVMSQRPLKWGIAAVLGLWGVWVFGTAGLDTLTAGLAPLPPAGE